MSAKDSVAIVLHDIGDMLTSDHQGQGDTQENSSTQSTRRDQGKSPEVRIPKLDRHKLRSGRANSSSANDEGAEVSKEEMSVGQNSENDRADHAYADKGRVLRKKRKSTTADAASTCCTVCGVTVRPSELQSHYDWEVDKLNKMLRPDGTRYRDSRPPEKERRKSASSSAKKKKDSADSDDAEDLPLDPEERLKEFERIKNRRQERLYSRLRKNKRANLVDDDTPSTSSAGDGEATTCPICQIVLTGSAEERNNHAEACLVARSSCSATNEDEDVDIEGDGFDEYTWCGQTRVRATSLLETGYRGLGYEVGNQSSDVDTELNIESDDESAEFGPPQYGEADIIPCSSEEMDERTQTLRNAILEGSQERVPPLHQEDTSVTNNCDANASKESNQQLSAESSSSIGTKPNYQGNPLYPEQSRTVLECLKARIEELEEMVSKQNSVRCLICMESYRNATVSVQCWHVHCEECWLRTLGAKKLCPQCNMITSPSQLRRIYL